MKNLIDRIFGLNFFIGAGVVIVIVISLMLIFGGDNTGGHGHTH